ncbi:MAG: hypothetical protein K2H69_03960, partial [Alistipes sp.]|nr:hypothetical protein [Alistipes sp.]
KDDGPVGTLTFARNVCLIEKAGGTASIEFTAVNIVSVALSDIPSGWSVTADLATHRVHLTAPAADTEDAETEGTLKLTGLDTRGHTLTAELRVGIGTTIDLTAEPSNCYVLNRADAYYSIDVTRKGEQGDRIAPAKVDMLWATSQNMVANLSLADGIASFLLLSDKNGQLIEGNALIAALDANDRVLWSWHLWITEYDPETDYLTSAAGDRFMARNLGAGANTNGTTEEVLASYGLYYQWGRPTPLIGPQYYDCAYGMDRSMFNLRNNFTYLDYVESTPETGTIDYAVAFPMSFILGVEASGYDWLYSAHDNELWGTVKTTYDPCPKGWRTPDRDAFAAFEIGDEHEADRTEALRRAYGWNLTDGVMTSFFLGGGRRSALLGGIQNVNTNDNPQPWIGCYWT